MYVLWFFRLLKKIIHSGVLTVYCVKYFTVLYTELYGNLFSQRKWKKLWAQVKNYFMNSINSF